MFEFWRFISNDHSLGAPIVGSYNSLLVVLSVSVASVAAYTALAVVDRVLESTKLSVRNLWLVIGAVAMGFGVWAMHFIAILAMSMPMEMSFDVSITFISVIPAIFGSGIALYVMSRDQIAWWRLQLGGLLMATGIGTMHYIGMEAIRMDALLRYDFTFFLLSIGVAHALASLALYIKFFPKSRFGARRLVLRLASACAMGLAVSGMHYTAMQASMFFPSDTIQTFSYILPPVELAIFIGIVTTLIIGIAMLGTLVDKHLTAVSVSLRQSEKFSSLLLESVGEGICGIDQDGNTTFVNPAAAEMLGYTVSDLIGCPMNQLIQNSSDSTPNVDPQLGEDRRIIGRDSVTRTANFIRHDKITFPVEFTNTPIVENGVIEGRVIMFRDITDRKLAETALKESEEKFRQIIEQTREVLWLCSPGGTKVVYVSPAYEKLTGYSCEDLYRNPKLWLELIHPEDRPRVRKYFVEKAIQGDDYSDEYRIVKSDDSICWISDHIFPINDVGGKLKYIAGFTKDISKRKQMEAEMRFSQKLEAVGQLAAGIAHEINTPTQYVGDNIQFLEGALTNLVATTFAYIQFLEAGKTDRITADMIRENEIGLEAADINYIIEEAPKAISECRDGINQIAKIVQAMKAFSHPGGENKEFADLNAILENTITVTRSEWKYVANLVPDLDLSIPKIPCQPQTISQVVMNLIVNASHAIKEKLGDNPDELGTITVTTRQIENNVEICVTDTGNGIPDEIHDKIFDPFFTTKGIGKGTGQGLSLARTAIVDGHGGTIRLETKVGKGTKFIIELKTEAALNGNVEYAA